MVKQHRLTGKKSSPIVVGVLDRITKPPRLLSPHLETIGRNAFANARPGRISELQI
jgi:hypothetical protein